MPIGCILLPYSSSSTLLTQYQSPFRTSLTFAFSSCMAMKNKGVRVDQTHDRASSLLSMHHPLRGGGGAVYDFAFANALSIFSSASRTLCAVIGFSSSPIVKLFNMLSLLAKRNFLVRGFRFNLLAILRKIRIINILILIFFDVI